MKIAVIGAGISGLSTAYLLCPHAEVTVYEKEPRVGGHAHTATVRFGDEAVSVDTGFMVFNPERYPYFIKLIQVLGVETVDTDMSFGVSIEGGFEYSSSFVGLFGNARQLFNRQYWQMLYQIVRFNRVAKQFLRLDTSAEISLGEFLDSHGFSQQLTEGYLYPMLGCIWSAGLEQVSQYPARETLRFLDNHRLLNLISRPQWQTILGGSETYVRRLVELTIRQGVTYKTNQSMVRVERLEDKVIVTASQETNEYDHVVFATHADTTLEILDCPTTQEQEILGGFSYSDNTVVLHSDKGCMPRRKSAWASWNYTSVQTGLDEQYISLSYYMNRLQGINPKYPLFVSLNPLHDRAFADVHETYRYTHPIFNLSARASQVRLGEIQNKHNTSFTGAYWGFGFHEDGIVSAVRAVESLGFSIRI